LIRAALTLACVTVFQSLVMAIYMRLCEPGQLSAVFRSWRVSAWAGVTGMIASAGWFTAMTIQNAAYVRALGQIELVFTFAAAVFVFHERPNRTEVIGIASGAFFGISAVSYRAAALSLGGEGFLMQAAFTLACVTLFQTLVMAIYMRLREPGQVTAVWRSWRVSGLVGLSGMLASACWFTAMTIQNAAYVRALGQIELLFTFAAGHFFFRERSNALELTGIGLVIAGILILLLFR
jgi:drug/metabolite transporter (DMT)-like permease